MRDHVLLFINGRRHEVRGAAVFAPLSSFLRYELEKTGTKVVCAEGDCGACAVLVGRATADGAIRYEPVTSCIAIVGQFDLAHVVTVEGLRRNGHPHAVPEAIVANHATQCGFCTPGFVVSLCGLLNEHPSPTEGDVRAALIGNLCRCTGYQSIVEAGTRVDHRNLRKLDELYPPPAMLEEMAVRAVDDVRVEDGGRFFFKPATVESAVAFRAQHPGCTILAGGTDVGVQVNKGTREMRDVLLLGALPGLRTIASGEDHLTVGAGATLTDLERATREGYPELYPMLTRHGSPLIRNAGTLAGNVANGSPIGDALPALYVLNAEIELARGATPSPGAPGERRGEGSPLTQRRINIHEFFTGYKRTVMTPEELITAIHIPRLGREEILRVYKVSKRRDLDISSFTAAVWLRRSGETIADVRIAYGGVGPNIVRLPRTEAMLRGQVIGEALFGRAGVVARTEITPISDVRGSTDYRLQLAENILLKFYFDLVSGANSAMVGAGQES